MKKLQILLLSGLGLCSPLMGMQPVTLTKDKDIEIQLKDANITLSEIDYNKLLALVDPSIKELLTLSSKKQLPGATKEAFEFLVANLGCFSQQESKECLTELFEKLFTLERLEEYGNLLALADYLGIEHLLDKAYEFNNQKIKEILSEMIRVMMYKELKTYTSEQGEIVKSLIALQNKFSHIVVFFDIDLKIPDKNYPQFYTFLTAEARLGNTEAVELLIEAGVPIDVQDTMKSTALIHATRKGHQDIVDLLIRNGATVDILDFKKATPLIIAANSGYKDIVERLLKAGAKINHQDDGEFTALMLAAQEGRTDIVNVLLEAGVDIHLENHYNATALRRASAKGHTDIVVLLHKAGADIHHQDEHGNTPLMSASVEGRKDTVEFLLEAGADVNHRNKKGQTALNPAIAWRNEEVADLLKEHGGTL